MGHRPITVLHVDSAREYRGGQNQARLLMAGLSARSDVRQGLVARAGSRLATVAASYGVTVWPVPWRGGVDPAALSALRARFASDWDVVHAHDGHAVQSVLAARAAVGGRAPVVAARRVDYRVRRPFIWCRADLVIAVSHAVRNVLLGQGIERRRIEVVYDGVDPADLAPSRDGPSAGELRARLGASPGEVVVAAVGALVGHKDHETFVRAAGLIEPREGVRFAVFGEGPARAALQALIHELGLELRFSLPGEIRGIARALDGIDIFVMPSRYEGLGTACIEAMLAGRPIVATNAGGLGELAVDGAFRPIPPGDPAALADAIARLLADPVARTVAGSAARAGSTRFSADAMVDGTRRCYAALARRGS